MGVVAAVSWIHSDLVTDEEIEVQREDWFAQEGRAEWGPVVLGSSGGSFRCLALELLGGSSAPLSMWGCERDHGTRWTHELTSLPSSSML